MLANVKEQLEQLEARRRALDDKRAVEKDPNRQIRLAERIARIDEEKTKLLSGLVLPHVLRQE
jgi:hypothetical protein